MTQQFEAVDDLLAHGRDLLGQKRHAEALTFFEQLATLDPNAARAWNNTGVARFCLTRYEDAVAAYNRAVALDSHSLSAWSNKGDALVAMWQWEEAHAVFDQALALLTSAEGNKVC